MTIEIKVYDDAGKCVATRNVYDFDEALHEIEKLEHQYNDVFGVEIGAEEA